MTAPILKLFIVRNWDIALRAFAFVREHWRQFVGQGEPLAIQIVPASAPRSVQQNRFYWGVLLAYIAEHADVMGWRYSAEQWHELFKRKFIGCEDLPDGGVVGLSSTGLSIKGFNDYMRVIEAYAVSELGIDFNGELDDGFAELTREEKKHGNDKPGDPRDTHPQAQAAR